MLGYKDCESQEQRIMPGESCMTICFYMRINLKYTYLSVLLIVLIVGCSSNNSVKKNEPKVLIGDREIYLLRDDQYGYICTSSTITKDLVLHVAQCEIDIDDFEYHKYYNEILKTEESKWIELLNSNSSDLAISTSTWLYFLSKEKLTLLERVLIQNWDQNFKMKQIKFWTSYLDKHDLMFIRILSFVVPFPF